MNKRLSLAIVAGLSTLVVGCQNVPSLQPTTASNESWTGMHLDQVQFMAETAGFSCLAPSGVDFDKRGVAFRSSMCFKAENCHKVQRVFYLEAHTMVVTFTKESRERVAQCQQAELASTPPAK